MNILIGFFNDNAKSGGAEGILRQVAEFYLRRGDEVHLLFLQQKQYGHWEENNQDNLHLYYGGGAFRRIGNIKKLKKTEFDYSYSSIIRVTGPLGLMKRLGFLRIKTMVGRESTSIFTRYKGWRLRYYQMWYRLGYKAVDLLICQTSYMKRQLLNHQPWLQKNSLVVVIPNPVDVALMEEKGSQDIDLKALKPFVVTAGRFIPEKAYDVLLKAFALLMVRKPEMKLVVLGDGSLRGQIERQIIDLGLSEHVFLQGQVENVYPWFKAADLCVVSSRLEGFPNVLLQMMSQNERVVSTLCAGDIDKIAGLVTCETDNADALEGAMIKAMEADVKGIRETFDSELESRRIEKFVERVEALKLDNIV